MWRRRLKLTFSVWGRVFHFVEFFRGTSYRHLLGMPLLRRQVATVWAGLARQRRSEAEVDRTLARRRPEGQNGGRQSAQCTGVGGVCPEGGIHRDFSGGGVR